MPRSRVVIVGSGWAGATLCSTLSDVKYSITVVSPETTTPYTPLLASAAAGLYDFSLVETPIRHTKKNIKFIKARVEAVDFGSKTCRCAPYFDDLGLESFELGYDHLILAPGCTNQTFGTPGVAEHALFVRNARDAERVAAKVNDCFEKASTPGLSEQRRRDLLHFVVVGGGPTGVEISSELSDLFKADYAKLYPHLRGRATIALHDVAPNILPSFDKKLRDYAMGSFAKGGVEVLTGSHIVRVEEGSIETKEAGRRGVGAVIWATGNKSVELVEKLGVRKTPKVSRILTDDFLRVLKAEGEEGTVEGVYALGDAADIQDQSLPTTAEVACQKGNWLAKSFNKGFEGPFVYQQTPIVAYLGQNDGVIHGKRDYTGAQAWMAWRSKNFLWTRTWRQKILIVLTWLLNLLLGRYNAPA